MGLRRKKDKAVPVTAPADGNTASVSKKKKKKKKSKFGFLISFIMKIAVFALVIWGVVTYVAEPYRMVGNGMFPMVKDGDLCILYKLDGYFSGDIVLYQSESGVRLGRVRGIAGQKVDIPEEGGFYVNDFEMGEEVYFPTERAENGVDFPITVEEDTFFILNDYRTDREDSRRVGLVPLSNIKGKVIFVLRRRGF